MFEFIFCTATPLSDRYKKSIVRRLQAKNLSRSQRAGETKNCMSWSETGHYIMATKTYFLC